MRLRMPGPTKHSKSKYLWFRMGVPHRLRHRVGKTEIKLSLHTLEPNEAKLAHARLQAEWRAKFQVLDREIAEESLARAPALVDQTIRQLAEPHDQLDPVIYGFLKFLAYRVVTSWGQEAYRDFNAKLAFAGEPDEADWADSGEPVSLISDDEKAPLVARMRVSQRSFETQGLAFREIATKALNDQAWHLVSPEVSLISSVTGVEIPNQSSLYDAVAEAFLTVLSNYRLASWDEHLIVMYSPSVSTPQPEAPGAVRHVVAEASAPVLSQGGRKLSEGLTRWQALAAPRPQSFLEAQRAVGRFINLFGDLPIGEITRDAALEYRDLIEDMPANLTPEKIEKKGGSLRTIIEEARRGAGAYRKLAPASIKKDVGALQAILGALANEGWIAQNVASGIRISGYSKTRKGQVNPRLPFRPSMMQALFDSPLFNGCAGQSDTQRTVPGDRLYQDELYWSFLFAATAGPRLEEIGQIRLGDIDEVDLRRAYGPGFEGTCTVIYLTGTGEDQSTKTDESDRVIVIHPRLLELGFSDYVRQRKAAGAGHLFELTRDKDGKFTRELSRRLNRYIDRVVTNDKRYTFHSLRHEWKDRAEESDIDEKLRDQITGHAPATVGRRYGLGASIRRQYVELQKLNLHFIDWPRLISAKDNGSH